MKISVLTPTYNREKLLERLYKSLVKNSKYGVEIEWLIMDDGSTDQTEQKVKSFIQEQEQHIQVKYYKQKNQGKMVAINNLVEKATGEYMIDCDSDDYFSDEAFKIMSEKIKETANEKNIYGLCFLKHSTNGENIGNNFTKQRTTLFDLHYKENDQGEKAILFISKIRKQYKHKLENGERFITEARLYYEMDDDNEMLCFNFPIMICEYQENGYTKNLNKQFKENPVGFYYYFYEILKRDFKGTLWNKRMYAIKHYILFSILTNKKIELKDVKNIFNRVLIVLLYLPGKIKTNMRFK